MSDFTKTATYAALMDRNDRSDPEIDHALEDPRVAELFHLVAVFMAVPGCHPSMFERSRACIASFATVAPSPETEGSLCGTCGRAVSEKGEECWDCEEMRK